MQTSPVTHNQTWTMKEAAKAVGCGLPRLYIRLRERGLFTQLGIDGRNLPTRKLQQEGLFTVENKAWWDPVNACYRPCPKVQATYKGLILLQEIADELAREKEQHDHQHHGVSDADNGDQGQREVLRVLPDAGAAGSHR